MASADGPPSAAELAWLTPSMVGDAATHPTSPYAAGGGAAPPPPAGLSEWYRVPTPQRIAQLGSLALGCVLALFFSGSALHAQFIPRPTTHQAHTIPATPAATQVPRAPQPQSNPASTTTRLGGTIFTVQLAAPKSAQSAPAPGDADSRHGRDGEHGANHSHAEGHRGHGGDGHGDHGDHHAHHNDSGENDQGSP
jgi:hypothetical protein